ncbi:SusC/RagA family TonB-linked outer membrane protein [Ancylomarina sp. DW003]|nr:SusC/RagA family TonB-linked outer membrane protein [Ancylomarina sp. DW003]MDE5423636.1 SusC/RagA family TonB-linked outer membrane protein [Ancylomarina sp. DW003]
MKMLAIFLLASVLSVSANTLAQDAKVTLNMEGAELEQVLWEIHEQTGLVFLYSSSDVKDVNALSVDAKEETVKSVLNRCLEDSGLEYEFKSKAVTLRKTSTPAKSPVKTQQQQTKKVSGVVLDDLGISLPGVSVLEKGTTNGVSTDFDGKFTIEIPANGKVVLVFSFIGMESQEVLVKGQKELKITLLSDAEQLAEVVVVSDGFRKTDRRLFTGSATTVKAADAKVAGITDVGQMLEGKAAGVSVQTVSGTFGAAPKIRVRGASSIYGDQKPLWVVDGVVLEDVVDVSPDDLSSGDASTLISSAVAGLNSDDIENFQILKDASATALYGARAMNGVIVITTKRGKKGSTSVSYSGEYTMRMKPSYSNYNIMNSREQMSVYRELEAKGWLNHAEISRQKNGGIYKKMYDLINTYDPTTGFGLQNTPEAKAKFLQKYEMTNTDWFDELFTNNITQNHSVSLTGGNEKSNFYFSTSYYGDKGWSIADKVDRYTVNANASVKLNDKLKVGFITAGSFRQQKAPGTVSRTEDPINGQYSRDFDINPFSYALNTSRVLRPYDDNGNLEFYRMNYADFNIINEMKNNYLDIDMLDLKLQANIDYELSKGLDLNFVGSIRYVKSTQEHKILENSNMASAYRSADTYEIAKNNKFLFKDNEVPNSLPQVVLPKGGFYNRSDNSLLNYYFRGTANWNKIFDETHIVNVMGGMEVKSSNRQNSTFDGVGYQWERGGVPYIDPNFVRHQLQNGISYYGMQEYRDRFAAFFATGSYSYAGKYTINGTFRYDGSNQLGQSSSARWLPTWNVSGSWNAHDEDFLRDSEVISHLSFRATYGLTASMGAATNSTLVLKNDVTDRPYLSEQESRMYIDGLENSELTWEKQYETNVGMDLGLFRNRINLSVDAYQRKGFDLIAYIKTSGIGGEFWKFANYADMESKGIEFTLTTHNVKADDFKWNTNLTFAYNKNEITKLKSFQNIYNLVKDVGGPLEGYNVRSLFSIKYKGLNDEGLPTFINENGETTVSDLDFQSNDIEHLKYEGSIDPKVTGGFGNNFTYKNWKLNVFMTYQFGNKVRLRPQFKAQYSDLDAMPKEFYDRWMLEGDEDITDIPVILSQRQYNVNYTKAYNAYNLSTARVADGSFVRMKEISLAYKLPKKFLTGIGFNSATLKLQGSNLFLIHSDKKLNGQDPEFMGSGGVAMPVPKQYTFSVKLGF